MPSFLHIFHVIEHDAAVGLGVAAPVIGIFNPAAGALAQTLSGSILRAEQLFADPTKKQGPDRKQFVLDEITNAMPLIRLGLQLAGKDLDPSLSPQVISDGVDGLVAALNALSKLSQSLQTVKAA